MESKIFKSVTFGGFDKQDVIHYIEETARQYEETTARLEKEKDVLERETADLKTKLQEAEKQLRALIEEKQRLEAAAQGKAQAEEALAQTRAEAESLRAEAEQLRPLAQAYQNVKEQIGDIECEARRRANTLEEQTLSRLNRLLAACRGEYQTLTETYATTSSHMIAELRKMEVSLTQLPRALDQVGKDLTELEQELGGR